MGVGGNKVVLFLRSLLFTLSFYVNFALMSLILPICLVVRFERVVVVIAKYWNRINVLLLHYICGVKYKIEGTENILNEPMLILSKHESTWETYFLYQYLKKQPVEVAKKELLYIPIFGFLLKYSGNILIDRKGGASSIKDLVRQAKHFVEKRKRSIMMFPQGTRVPVGGTTEEYPYKGGFYAILDACNLPILPVVLDSGKCWPKGSFLKRPCTINIKFLPVISREQTKNLDRKAVVDLVEKIIEGEREKMK
jgi:1-acyl-sn-glycerol-3-phosphate acyltransferase